MLAVLAAVTVGHSLIVAILLALLLAAIVGVAFHFFAAQYAAPTAFLTFLVLLVLLLL